jgi:dienelactone hydrolase
MPPDLHIVAPGPNVPAEMSRFAGGWGKAAWGGVLPTALVVERVEADGAATVVYAVGASEQSAIPARWVRTPGQIADGRLNLRVPAGVTIDFAFAEDDDNERLVGHHTVPRHGRSVAWLSRLPGDAAQVAAALAQPVRPPWEELRIPVRSAVGDATGQTLLLQAFLYRSASAGPRPLAVFNHGSTDGEPDGVPSIHPEEAQARFFLARGWDVLVPMRKGRGHSEGPMLEASSTFFISEEQQLESGLEDLDAVVRHMRVQSYVDPARILVAGQSRGGLLSVAYAGRHPGAVAGVVNFSGGWWSEIWDRNGFNQRQAALAGARTKVPILWLYGDQDPYYTLPYVRRVFGAFRDAGGTGHLVEFDDVPGNGHALVRATERWHETVSRFLDGLHGGSADERDSSC